MTSSPQGAPAPAPAAPATALPAPAGLAKALDDGMYAKATMPFGKMFLLSLTGGAFIALGFIYMVTSQQGMAGEWPTGIAKILGGVTFSVGLGLVLISGSDLFTGTTMTVVPLLTKRISVGQMLKHWAGSISGNFIGSVLVAVLVFLAGTHATNKSAWGKIVLDVSLAKVSYDWHQAFFLGILANFAVCLAVWVGLGGKTVVDKVIAVVGPISLFVAAGFEHSVANMFMLPMGLLVKYFAGDTFWSGQVLADAGVTQADYDALTPLAVLGNNLVPVILGNIVGGAVFVGVYFWACYLRSERKTA
ncbi:formate/nitrite transporter family protein [Brachybacterium timonense]|uniref:formate/nitrite transporter family protein n=1 Tax=Brachybacterium timonense TaxID=2050896 RepID=UPI000D0B0B3F|nr:formate/nitrite transporter family protein [Brachybacterium timonense]